MAGSKLPVMEEVDLAGASGAHLRGALAAAGCGALSVLVTRLTRLFRMHSPWAPGLHFFGAQAAHPGWPDGSGDGVAVSLAGSGSTEVDALAACVGEFAERVSSFERIGDVAMQASLSNVRARLPSSIIATIEQRFGPGGDSVPLAWCRGHDPVADCEVLLPAAWTVRRASSEPVMIPGAALSTGVAAGPTFAEAALRAQLELVERDAAALWWIGGRRGRSVDLAGETDEIATLVANLRGDNACRRTWFLDITTDLGVPVVAAISSMPDGTAVAIGLGARLTIGEAAAAALYELCQMEIGMQIALVKLEQAGPDALTPTDRLHVLRANLLDTASCPLLVADGPADGVPVSATLAHGPLLRPLAQAPGELAFADLTRADIAVPVVRAVAGRLQPMPGRLATMRLAAAHAEHGGGARWTKGVGLM